MPDLDRNPLAFPCGIAPGFDPGHVAAGGIVNGYGFSGVASGANIISLLAGEPGTLVNTPTASIRGDIGPATYITSTQGVEFSGNATKNALSFTIACILAFNAIPTATAVVFSSTNNISGSSKGSSLLVNASSHFQITANNAAGTDTGFALTAGIPYFIAVSNGPIGAAVLVDLRTGQMKTFSGGAVTPGAPTNGTYAIGNSNNTRPADARFAAAMFSPVFQSLPQLTQWAADPWSFWYPQRD